MADSYGILSGAQMGASTGASTSGADGASGSYAGYGLTSLGGLVSAYAQYQAGQANKKIARFNAGVAKQQGAQAIQAGRFAANRVAERERLIEAADDTHAAAGNVLVNAGSAHLVKASNAAQSEMDRVMIELNARREAYGFQTRAMASTMEGNLAAQRGEMGAAETLMNTGSKLWLEADENHAGYAGRGIKID